MGSLPKAKKSVVTYHDFAATYGTEFDSIMSMSVNN